MILSLSQFAKKFDVTKKSVEKNIKSGLIESSPVIDDTGKVKRHEIDITTKKNKAYILTIDRDRQHGNRMAHGKKQNLPVKSNSVSANVDPDDLPGRYSIARVRKLEAQAVEGELKNAVRRGELLEKESVYQALFLGMDKLISHAERFAESFLPDIVSEILEKKELTNEIRAKWKDGYFQMVDNWKNGTSDKLKEMEKGQR